MRFYVTPYFFTFWSVLLVKLIYFNKRVRFFRISNFQINFWVVIIELDISWFNFWKEEEIVYNNWYIYFFFCDSALCYIDLCKHDYCTVNRHFCKVFRGGVKQLNFCLLFFCIFLFPTRKLLPYPRGVHYWSWNINWTICRCLAGPWNSVCARRRAVWPMTLW